MGVVALATYSHSLKTLIFYISTFQHSMVIPQGVFCVEGIEIDFSGCSNGRTVASQKRVSWLKIEPVVSIFPVLETDGTVSSTRATGKSHFYFGVRI